MVQIDQIVLQSFLLHVLQNDRLIDHLAQQRSSNQAGDKQQQVRYNAGQ